MTNHQQRPAATRRRSRLRPKARQPGRLKSRPLAIGVRRGPQNRQAGDHPRETWAAVRLGGDNGRPAAGGQKDESRQDQGQDQGTSPADVSALQEEPGQAPPVKVSTRLDANRDYLARELGYGESFDILMRPLQLAGRQGLLVAVDGFVKDDVLLRVVQFINSQGPQLLEGKEEEFGRNLQRAGIGYIETEAADTLDQVVDAVLAGQTAILVEGSSRAILLDMRTYPARDTEEPDLERVIRGPRDGFAETLVYNTALIRRRLRDPRLRMEMTTVGTRSKTDVVLTYIKDIADPRMVDQIRSKLKAITTDGVPMAERTIQEFLVGRRHIWNLFPTVRFTERPDVAAVHLLEGHLAIITDTSPAVMLLPITFFHHLQHAQEFHEDPLIGMYIRLLRYFGVFLSWLGPALWLAATLQVETLPQWLRFIGPREGPGPIPLYLQLIFAEMGIDLIRLALIHTPNTLASSLGIIGAILLGELAVSVGLFVPEVILYVALATIGNFATPSVELSNAIRIQRLLLLLLAGIGGLPALGVGLLAVLLIMLSTRSFGVPYLWPLVPFNGRALVDVVFRKTATAEQARPSFLRPRDPDRS